MCLSCTGRDWSQTGLSWRESLYQERLWEKETLKRLSRECRVGGELCCWDLGAGTCCGSLCPSPSGTDFGARCSPLKLGFWRGWQAGAERQREGASQSHTAFDVVLIGNSWNPPCSSHDRIPKSEVIFFLNYLIKCKDFFKDIFKCLHLRSVCRFSFKFTWKGNIWDHINTVWLLFLKLFLSFWCDMREQ